MTSRIWVVWIIFTCLATFQYDLTFGDPGVFLTTHQFLDSGSNLYIDVWDHKDLGFYFLGQIFFSIFGPIGLVLQGLLCWTIFSIAIIKKFSEISESPIANELSLIFIFYLITFSQSFIIFQPEFISTLLAISGILAAKSSYRIGSLFIGLSVLVKISMAIFIPIFILILYASPKNKGKAKKIIQAIGFIIAPIFLVSLIAKGSILNGWIEIIEFNQYYSEYVRGYDSSLLLAAHGFLTALIRTGYGVLAYGGKELIISLVVVSGLGLWRFTNQRDGLSLLEFKKLEIVAMAMVAASIVSLVPQAPPSFHHYFIFLVPISMLAGLSTMALASCPMGYAVSVWFTNRKGIFVSTYSILLVALVVISFNERGVLSMVNVKKFISHSSRVVSATDLVRMTNVALIRANHDSPTYSSLNSIELGCRHHYQLDHIILFYGSEIQDCVRSRANYVVLKMTEIEKTWKLSNPIFFENLTGILSHYFKECSSSVVGQRIFARGEELCVNVNYRF